MSQSDKMNHIIGVLIIAPLLVGLPLLGVIIAGLPMDRFLEVPPVTRYVPQAGFSWIAAALIAGVELVAVFLAYRVAWKGYRNSGSSSPSSGRFPWWGGAASWWA
jgi:hypothetical protein